MNIEKKNELGSINIEKEAIATLAGGAISECLRYIAFFRAI